MSWGAFTEVYQTVDTKASDEALVALLTGVLANLEGSDKLWLIALFLGKGPKRIATLAELKEWAIEESGLSHWMFEECLEASGDLAETIALVIHTETSQDVTLTSTIDSMKRLKGCPEEERKREVISRWKMLDSLQRLVFNKIVTGTFRQRIAMHILARAIAHLTDRLAVDITVQLNFPWNPDSQDFESLIVVPTQGVELARPYAFENPPVQLDTSKPLGNIGDWFVERAFAGIAAQIVIRNGDIWTWSANGELITSKCPEFRSALEIFPDGLVMVGQVIATKDGKILTADRVIRRLKKKTVSKKDLEETPLQFVAKDLLEMAGQDVRTTPFAHRREQLSQLIAAHPDQPFVDSERIRGESWDAVEQARLNSRAHYSSGLLLNKADSVCRGSSQSLFWPADPYMVRAVLLYAQRGQTGTYSEFNLAVDHGGQFVPFARVSKGLSEDEMDELDVWIKDNTLERFGPVSSVRPELIFEICFDGIAPSSRTKSGVVLQAPRIHKWNREAEVTVIHSLSSLQELID